MPTTKTDVRSSPQLVPAALSIGSALVLMKVRKRIRDEDNIGSGPCGDSEDCCCSFWCGCCVNIQIFSQIQMRRESGYQLCSPEGIEGIGI